MKIKEFGLFGVLVLVFTFNKSMAQTLVPNSSSSDLGNGCYQIVPPLTWQTGAVWSQSPIDLNQPFSVKFFVSFSPSSVGADGLTFAFQSVGNSALGVDGQGLGYESIFPSFAVEIDIFQNGELADPEFDHIAVHRAGSVLHNGVTHLFGPIQASSSASIKTGNAYPVEITWNPENQQFFVFFDCEQKVFMTYDLINQGLNGNANVFWGFTGSTGGEVSDIRVCLRNDDPVIPMDTVTTCPGQPVQLSISDIPSGNYSWSPAEFLNNPNSETPIATVNESTLFTAMVNDFCDDSYPAQVFVEVVNDLAVEINGATEACEGNELQLFLPEGPNYEWNTGDTSNTLIVNMSGTYWVTAEQLGCTGSDTVDVVFFQGIQQIILESEPADCGAQNGSVSILEVAGGTPPFMYTIDSQTQNDSIFNGLGEGIYLLTVNDSEGCVFEEAIEISSQNLTEANFEVSPTSGTAPLQLSLTNSSLFATDGFYFLNEEFIDLEATSFEIEEAGAYTLALVVWSNDPSCADTASITINVDEEIRLQIPNVITPNNDGRNDDFRVNVNGIRQLSLDIYNRWGRILLENKTISPSGAGLVLLWQPEEESAGMYHYILRFEDVNGVSGVREGHIMLLRD